MSTKLKLYLGRKVADVLSKATKFTPIELLPLIEVGTTHQNRAFLLNLPLNILEKRLGVLNVNEILKIQPDEIITQISTGQDRANRQISFEIERNIFIQDIIENAHRPDLNLKPKTIVVEFSSPNIAKPFHLGHLRSTIIGNFISNLNNFIHNKVTRLNYLGDWGTQFGYVKVGVDDLEHSSDAIRKNPLKLLYQSYVYANKMAENDPKVADRARSEFTKLEQGVPDSSRYWKRYMEYSRDELESTYSRLGVKFDEYCYESMYSAKDVSKVVQTLIDDSIIVRESDGRLVATLGDHRKVTVVKSDGSTLYLTRDIAAAMDRYDKFKFDKMYYVVDNGQSDHFNALKTILHKMSKPWAHNLHHVKFGRVKGMSTRRGTAVFLSDILDEARDLMVKRRIQSLTTKTAINDEKVSDILGISCVVVNDLKQRRQKDYEFSWDRILQVEGDTGIKLQYTHCRLNSLMRNSGQIPAMKPISEMLDEPEATNLIKELARFHEVLLKSGEQLEACILVTYLFHLCNYINKAIKVLKVKGSEPDVGTQRLLLFKAACDVLKEGMMILGLQPLNEM